jgi:hypothetical protein
MKKHAYLIIAHNEFEILKLLVAALDDARNDIYIHFDAKCGELPLLKCAESKLYILPKRIDVRWGDYSQIETELQLFEYAHGMLERNGVSYQYYHLLSGVDIPLKNQDYIHDFFNTHKGKEFLGFYQGNLELELRKKVQMYHLFPKNFTKDGKWTFRNIVRAVFCRLQLYLGIKRNKDICLVRGGNWASVTNEFVEFLLSKKKEIKKRFHHTFCADEVYKHTLCWNSKFKDSIYNPQNEALGCMRDINWIVTERFSYLPSFTMDDFERLRNSPMLYARKFDAANIDIVKRIISEL